MAKDRTLGLKLRAIDRMSATIDRVQKRFPKLTRSIRRASRVSKIFNEQTKRMRRSLQKIGGGLKRFGIGLALGVTLPLVAVGAAGVKTFATFEQGLRGIEKTTGLTRGAVAKLGVVFSQLSTEVPVTTSEMLTLAQAGGQLGIKTAANIEKFTITMAKLGRASDVAGEDGAKSIARILTVTGDGIGKVQRFSSALVDLGNNAAAGEQEILEVAVRVAGQIGRFDVASAAVLGISTALRALGKRAESAGSVVGRAFDAIDQSIKGGGKQMQLLSKLTDITTKNLKKAFKEDAAAVFQKFIIGLSKVEKGGGNLIKVMGAMGLQGVRINDILGTLAKRPEVLAENLERATRAFAENTALQKEFAIQTDSLESVMKVIGNTFTDFIKLVGKDLAPAVKLIGGLFKGVFNFLRNNPTIRTLVIVFAALAAVLGPILIVMGGFLILLPALSAGMLALSTASLPITGTMLLIGAAIIAVITVVTILIVKWKTITKFFSENPFGKFIKFIFLVLTPIGLLITSVRLIIAAFSGLDAIGEVLADTFSVFGFGDDKELKKKLKRDEDEVERQRLEPKQTLIEKPRKLLPDIFSAAFGDKLNKNLKEIFATPIGAKRKTRGLAVRNARGQEQDLRGRIDVDFRNAPAGTKIRSEAEGPLDLQLGFVGGIL